MKDYLNIAGLIQEDLLKFFFRPNTVDQLKDFLKNNTKEIQIIGAGSNLLIRDGGVKGVVIKLSSSFSYTKLLDKNIIEAGAATLDKKVSDFASEKSLGGLEFLSCIPGSIGGAIRMNSGCYGEDISKILLSIQTIDKEGNINELKTDDINFTYRNCDLPNDVVILSAKFKTNHLNKQDIENKKKKFIENKKNSQPSRIKTCGSTFKNPNDIKAWELIKKSGCGSISVGDAEISKKHCNFFVNNGQASSSEIETLIKIVREKVFKATGIKLELEIKVIGKDEV